jgi:hypothetical protein
MILLPGLFVPPSPYIELYTLSYHKYFSSNLLIHLHDVIHSKAMKEIQYFHFAHQYENVSYYSLKLLGLIHVD